MSTGKKIMWHIIAFLVILFVCQCCFGDEGTLIALCLYLGGIGVYYLYRGLVKGGKATANYVSSHHWIKYWSIIAVLFGINLLIDVSLGSGGLIFCLLGAAELVVYIWYSIKNYSKKKKQKRLQKEQEEKARQQRAREAQRRAQQSEESLRRKVADLERENESLRRQQSSGRSSSSSTDYPDPSKRDYDRERREREERSYQRALREWEEERIEITVTFDEWVEDYPGSYEGQWTRDNESVFVVPRNQVASYIQGGASAMLNGISDYCTPSKCRNVRWKVSRRYNEPRPERWS